MPNFNSQEMDKSAIGVVNAALALMQVKQKHGLGDSSLNAKVIWDLEQAKDKLQSGKALNPDSNSDSEDSSIGGQL